MSGRIRTIKPELLEDAKTASLSDKELRLFVASILLSDDHGSFRAHTGFIHGAVFWARPDESADDTASALNALEDLGLIERYMVRGQTYGHLSGWHKHQRVDHPGKPRVPGKEDPEAWFESKSWVYFVQQGETGPIKIGRAVNVERRVSRLQTATPHRLSLLGVLEGGDREAELHRDFARLQIAGEWFRPERALLEFIKNNAKHPTSRDVSPETLASTLAPDHDLDLDLDHDLDQGPPVAGSDEPASPVLPGVITKTPRRPTPEVEVFNHWLDGWKRVVKGTRTPILDTKRRGKIRARLGERFTVQDLKQAIDGLWKSTWHIENKRHDIELVCRDAAHVEQFMTEAGNGHAQSQNQEPDPDPNPEPPSDAISETDRNGALPTLTPEQRASAEARLRSLFGNSIDGAITAIGGAR